MTLATYPHYLPGKVIYLIMDVPQTLTIPKGYLTGVQETNTINAKYTKLQN